MRSAIVLLDGVDEAAQRKDEVQEFVLQTLVRLRFRVVVTSRPEGVEKGLKMGRFDRFVVVNLKKLAVSEQRSAVRNQLLNNAAAGHLMAASELRKRHNEIYEKLHADERSAVERAGVEPKIDRFRLNDAFDLSMIQKINGRGLREVSSVQSSYLLELRKRLTDDSIWAPLCATYVEWRKTQQLDLKHLLEERHAPDTKDEGLKVAIKLLVLAHKLAEREAEQPSSARPVDAPPTGPRVLKDLWHRIERRTDELYRVAKPLLSVFKVRLHPSHPSNPLPVALTRGGPTYPH